MATLLHMCCEASALRGLILLSSRAHGKAENYSLFNDLASKGFPLFVAWGATGWKSGDVFLANGKLFSPTICSRLKKDKKNPETMVPGLIHTNEEGGGDMVRAAKTSVEFNIAKQFVRRNIYLKKISDRAEEHVFVGLSLLSNGFYAVIGR